jgi:glycerol-3-phosphate dehydrogenase
VLKLDHPQGGAPLLSVFGGKITTFRKLAESAMEKIAPFFPALGKPWTAGAALPGGDFAHDEVESRIAALRQNYPFVEPRNIRRMFRAYGTDVEAILGDAKSPDDLGRRFGPLSEREVEWLVEKEWVRAADDILWRRSKLGLHMSNEEQAALQGYFAPGKAANPMLRAGE